MKRTWWMRAVCLGLLALAGWPAQAVEYRQRTVLVTPDQSIEQAPTILVHEANATTFVFEAPPKAVKIDGARDRIVIHQVDKLVVLLPTTVLGNNEQLTMVVTDADGARLVFNLEDGFNTFIDGQITVRRGKASLMPEPEEGFVKFLLAQDREALKSIAYRAQQKRLRATRNLDVEGVLTGLGFAFVSINLTASEARDARIRLYGETSGDLEVVGISTDYEGVTVAVKKPAHTVDSFYTVEAVIEGIPRVTDDVSLWPTAAAQRTTNEK